MCIRDRLLPFRPARHLPVLRAVLGIGCAIKHIEQTDLHGVALSLFGGFDGDTDRSNQARPVTIQRIEGAGANQRFDGAPVHHPFIGAQAKIEQDVYKRQTLKAMRQAPVSGNAQLFDLPGTPQRTMLTKWDRILIS